jgi:RNA polymerase sigma-B factor
MPHNALIDSTELFMRFRDERDPRLREEIVARFLPLAHAIARRYLTRREPFEDVLQVANLGLVKAVDRFDPDRGTAFASFATPTILGELRRYFRDFGWAVHVTRSAQERALKVGQGQRKLEQETGRSPTVNELAEYLELGFDEVVEALQTATAHYATSLDAPTDGAQGSGTLADALGEDDEGLELVDARMTISAAARRLRPLDRRVLALRFVDEMTQSQIAAKIGVSQMQVSRILRRAVNELRGISERTVDRHQDRAA